MSMVITRSPLVTIGMNGGAMQKRRSARLSQEGNGENEPPAKRAKVNGNTTTTINTKEQDGENGGGRATGKREKKVYDKEVEGFTFSKGKRSKGKGRKEPQPQSIPEEPSEEGPMTEKATSVAQADTLESQPAPTEPPAEKPAPKTAQKKSRRRLPASPERDVQQTVRRSKRLSNEHEAEAATQPSPHRPSHTKSHANTDLDRSPSPEKARPVTIEKKRKRGINGVEEEKVMTISLPFADTPIIRRNKEMRKTSAEGHRRSSAGMRGRRASSLIDEGRGHEASRESNFSHVPPASDDNNRAFRELPTPLSMGSEALSVSNADFPAASNALADMWTSVAALPHSEVPASEFFKHISADLTEPRRMRCLLGWCGTRTLPPKPLPPTDSTPAASQEFQALQSARIIQAEISQDLITRGALSDWFSRDESAPPQIPLKKKPNPRNLANTAKAEELERELERLKRERAEWDELVKSTTSTNPDPVGEQQLEAGTLSPLRPEVLDSPQRSILERLKSTSDQSPVIPGDIQRRIGAIAEDLEFAVDQFAHGIHTLSTTRTTAEKVADKSLTGVALALEEREKQRTANSKPANQMDALRGLARLLNAQYRA